MKAFKSRHAANCYIKLSGADHGFVVENDQLQCLNLTFLLSMMLMLKARGICCELFMLLEFGNVLLPGSSGNQLGTAVLIVT